MDVISEHVVSRIDDFNQPGVAEATSSAAFRKFDVER